ncbi:MAG: DHH family phosphoesterase [Desulfobacterales bacterium]|jgi:nanoRNase/pAp phosphatase (c-di-AMP/oligoRNAs hydrolase)
MENSFPKSVPSTERLKKLFEVVNAEDIVAVLIKADPDAMASAYALKRLFWRKVKRVDIVRINKIKRADNLAFANIIKLNQRHIRNYKRSEATKWALLDSQPTHDEEFGKYDFDIIIDHHPTSTPLKAAFIDIREKYGANSTILSEYLRTAKIKPSPKLATALFYGIKTDTDNFVRNTVSNDIKAFRYLYEFTNLNIIKKIESSEMTKKNIPDFKVAMEKLTFVDHTAFIHMGNVDNADTLVILADFFMKMAEATWSVVSGVLDKKLVVIYRNAGFRRSAGKLANNMFGDMGSAGGHKSMARAEIPIEYLDLKSKKQTDFAQYMLKRIKNARKDLI